MAIKVVAGGGVRKTALEVARGLGVKLLLDNTTYDISQDTVINWGNSNSIEQINGFGFEEKILNQPSKVRIASSKTATLEALKGEYAVEYTTDKEVAKEWLEQGYYLVGRELDRGSGGEGIHMMYCTDDFFELPLYTKYFTSAHELRIHVGKLPDSSYTIIDIQRKSLRTDELRPDVLDFSVRNHNNGFIFERGGLESIAETHLNKAKAVCMAATDKLGLDFCAIDLRMRGNGKCKILEVNTAPGLSGTTLDNYIEYFTEVLYG